VSRPELQVLQARGARPGGSLEIAPGYEPASQNHLQGMPQDMRDNLKLDYWISHCPRMPVLQTVPALPFAQALRALLPVVRARAFLSAAVAAPSGALRF